MAFAIDGIDRGREISLEKFLKIFSQADNFYIFVFANGDKMCLKTASKADKWLRLSLLPLLCADVAEVPIFTRKKPSTYLFS